MQVKFIPKAKDAEIDDRLFGIQLTLGKFADLSANEKKSDNFNDHEYTVDISQPDVVAIRHNHGIGLRLSVNGTNPKQQRDVDFTCIALKSFAQENNIKCLISNDANTSGGAYRNSWFFCGDLAKLIKTAHNKGMPLPFSEFAVADIIENIKSPPKQRAK